MIHPTQLQRKSCLARVERPSANDQVHFSPRVLEVGIQKQRGAPRADLTKREMDPLARGHVTGAQCQISSESSHLEGKKMASFQGQSAKRQEGSFGSLELGNPLAKSRER